MSSKIEEIQKRRAERRQQHTEAEAEQFEKDLEALEKLELEHDSIVGVKVRFVPGQPTRAFLRAPTSAEYRRYRDLVGKAAVKKNVTGQTEAQDQLAKACWVYPTEPKDREAMLEEFPGLLASIVIEAAKLAEGKAEEEGKD